MSSTSTPSREASPATAPSMARRWSPAQSRSPPRSPPVPETTKPSSCASIRAPSPRRPSTTPAMRSDSLTRSSPAPRTTVSPSAKQPSSATSGSSSISNGTSSGPTSVATNGAAATSRSLSGSRSGAACSGDSTSPSTMPPMRSITRSRPQRVQLTPTPCTSSRDQAGEQQARLELRAGHRHLVGDPLQGRAVNGERGVAPVASLDLGSHLAQRLGDPIHRAPADRGVAVERPAPAALAGQPPGQQAHERARVAHVDGRVGLARLAQTGPPHHQLVVASFDEGPQDVDGVEGGGGVGRREKVGDPHRLRRHRTEDGGPV